MNEPARDNLGEKLKTIGQFGPIVRAEPNVEPWDEYAVKAGGEDLKILVQGGSTRNVHAIIEKAFGDRARYTRTTYLKKQGRNT